MNRWPTCRMACRVCLRREALATCVVVTEIWTRARSATGTPGEHRAGRRDRMRKELVTRAVERAVFVFGGRAVCVILQALTIW